MPMQALVSSMPMPSYDIFSFKLFNSAGDDPAVYHMLLLYRMRGGG